jgi:hypothetical protein
MSEFAPYSIVTGPVMDAFDRFWQWANKPLESQLTTRSRISLRSPPFSLFRIML